MILDCIAWAALIVPSIWCALVLGYAVYVSRDRRRRE